MYTTSVQHFIKERINGTISLEEVKKIKFYFIIRINGILGM